MKSKKDLDELVDMWNVLSMPLNQVLILDDDELKEWNEYFNPITVAASLNWNSTPLEVKGIPINMRVQYARFTIDFVSKSEFKKHLYKQVNGN